MIVGGLKHPGGITNGGRSPLIGGVEGQAARGSEVVEGVVEIIEVGQRDSKIIGKDDS